MEQKKKTSKKSAGSSPLPLAIVTVFGIAAGITMVVADHTPRISTIQNHNSVAVQEEFPTTTVTTEVTALSSTTGTETAATAETTVTTQVLPEGSVTGIRLTFYEAALRIGDAPVMPIVHMTPENAADKTEKWETSDASVATVDQLGNITPVGAGKCKIKVTSVNNPAVFAEVNVSVINPNDTVTAKKKTEETAAAQTAAAETTQTTAAAGGNTGSANAVEQANLVEKDGITYINGDENLMIVNKTYTLPASYNPGGLLPQAASAFKELQNAASADGYKIVSVSDFRSYDEQNTLYNNYVARDGKEAADRFSARAGHSEHQTGLTIDCNYAGDGFNSTPEAKWLADNSWKYGFIIRYPEGKEGVTGFKYESWHIRYVGKDYAKKLYDSGLSMEEYFGLESKYAE